MTVDEAFVLWCERCGLDPDLPESVAEWEQQLRLDRENELADRYRAARYRDE